MDAEIICMYTRDRLDPEDVKPNRLCISNAEIEHFCELLSYQTGKDVYIFLEEEEFDDDF